MNGTNSTAMVKKFARYGRCSTEDNQSPDVSQEWQWDICEELVAGWEGVLVDGADYFDAGVSRSLPWFERPEAQRLLADLRRPDRPFDHIVIAEHTRGFSGTQYTDVIRVLRDSGITLWVGSIGRIEPDNPMHDMLMTMGGLVSKAEREQMRLRVRGGMRAKVRNGSVSYLGGRELYGYSTVEIGPHPIRAKAEDGKMLLGYEVLPDEAEVVQRIYSMYLAGDGYKKIAQVLTDEGIDCPSKADPDANPDRHGLSWNYSAVRSILKNPTWVCCSTRRPARSSAESDTFATAGSITSTKQSPG